MKIKFNRDCELEIVERIGDDGEPVWTGPELFRAGTEIEVDLIDHPEGIVNGTLEPDTDLWNIQFGNGSMAMAVNRHWFNESH